MIAKDYCLLPFRGKKKYIQVPNEILNQFFILLFKCKVVKILVDEAFNFVKQDS